MGDLRIACKPSLFHQVSADSVLLGLFKDSTEFVLFTRRELLWEEDIELHDEVATGVVHHDWGKGVVVQNRHSMALEYLSRARGHNLVWCNLEKFAVKRCEFKWRHCQGVQK